MDARGLALVMDGEMAMVVGGVAVCVLGVVWFGLRFWLAMTKPVGIEDVETPGLDQLNQKALEHMAEETMEEDEAAGQGEGETG